MSNLTGQFVSQLLALITFFAFPAIQYLFLKRFSQKEGSPELWYLSKYGFRLVIRNLPGKKTLSDMRVRTITRKTVPKSSGSSVATYQDEILVDQEDFFLFPGNDQVLVSFQIKGSKPTNLSFVLTDKLGEEKRKIKLADFDRIISYYTATIENLFNFDVKLAKQVEINSSTLIEMWKKLQSDDREQRFEIDRVRDVG